MLTRVMSSHLAQLFVLPCGLPGEFPRPRATSSFAASSSGRCLAMRTGGRSGVRARCEPRGGEGEASTSEQWMAGALAALVVVGAAAAAEPAKAFGWFGAPQVEKDPVEPFTVYGSIVKKYLIEDVVEDKVVSRRKGFTASSCINTLDASKETPELQGVPTSLKVNIIGEPSCAKGEGQTREESCASPCRQACQEAITRHLREVKQETGYVLDASDVKKVTEACSLQCFNECTKPGKNISFVFPFRPH